MSELNKQQLEAVEHETGPLLVVAGAGTGKTRVIVERIAKLIDSGVNRRNILALTFTEKAAQEMLDRVGERLQDSYGIELNIFTFNAFGQEILREFAPEIGLSNDLQLIGDTGKVVLLRENLDDLGLDYFAPVSAPDGQLAAISEYFSKLKQQLVTPAKYIEFANNLPANDADEKLERQRHQELANAFGKYIELCRGHNLVDYDDQIYLLVQLLEGRPNILSKLHARFTHLLVDEFQDTNPMQSLLLDLLAGKNQNIMAVGDDDQSIYGWRGATLANILEFGDRYGSSKSVTLVDNYRSTQGILDAAYTLIQNNNPDRLEAIQKLNKRLIAHQESDTAPTLEHFDSINAEIDWIANDVARRIEAGEEPGSLAVLTRRNMGAKKISEMLSYYNIDHTLAGVSQDLYSQPIITGMLEALQVAVDTNNNSALYHTLTGPLFELDPQAIGEVAAQSRRTHQQLEQALVTSELAAKEIELINTWRALVHEKTVSALAYQILDESGLKDKLYAAAQDNEDIASSVQVLGQWFVSLRDFQAVSTTATAIVYLDDFEALRASGETIGEESFADNLPVVMSVHKAKGLEWDTVYIADCTEYSFPLKSRHSSLEVPEELSVSSSADDHMAEERRLMYVACTRARKNLALSYSDTHTGTTRRKPSRFLVEIFGDDLEGGIKTSKASQTSLDLFGAAPSKAPSVQLPNKMKAGSDLVLTTSQLNDYFRCPLDFYYRHVLHVPAEPSPASSVGTLFHALIHEIHVARLNQNKTPSLEELTTKMRGGWPQEGYLSAKQRDRALDTAIEAFAATYARISTDPAPVSAEEPFRIKVPDSNVILTGRIDAVFDGDDGLEIVDYKTSTAATTAEKAKRSTTSSKQLEMYALAWREKHGVLPDKVVLDFVQTNQVGKVAKRESTIDNLAAKISAAGKAITMSDFPVGSRHDFCRHPQAD